MSGKKGSKHYSEETVSKIRDLSKTASSVREIAIALGLSRQGVQNCFDRYGIKLEKIEAQENEFVNRCAKEYWTKVRKDMGIGYERARKILESRNIPIPTRADAAKKRMISLDDLQSRIQDGILVDGRNPDNTIRLKCLKTGFLFNRKIGDIEDDSPFGKPGHPLTLEEFSQRAEEIGHKVIEFNGTKQPAILICPNGHTRKVNRAYYALKFGCPECNFSDTSKTEIEILNKIKSLGIEAHKHKILNNELIKNGRKKEIDIFIPSKNIGIEYCGLYWHSEQHLGDKHRHLEKMKLCEAQGIRLVTIFEDEWVNRKDQVWGFLESILSDAKHKINARDCDVQINNKAEVKQFLSQNHIQGSGKINVSFAISFKGETVAAMTASEHHRKKTDGVLILNRFAVKRGYHVKGGASRLFSYLKKWAIENGYKKIVSWSDNRWSQGNVYKKLGFVLEAELPPDYSYVKNGKRISKQQLRKKESEKNLGLTELQIRTEQGFSRIWDCGKRRWAFYL